MYFILRLITVSETTYRIILSQKIVLMLTTEIHSSRWDYISLADIMDDSAFFFH